MQNTLALTWMNRFDQISPRTRDIVLVFAGSWFVAALALISVPLPFSPVPVTGQTLGVLLVGAALGSKRGAASMMTYLGQGILGMPFFAGGATGWVVLTGPRGGYLLGFVAAAYIVGLFAERKLDRRLPTALLAFLLGHAAVFVFGVTWLSFFVGNSIAIQAGLVPFLPGMVIKTAAAALLLPKVWKWSAPVDKSLR